MKKTIDVKMKRPVHTKAKKLQAKLHKAKAFGGYTISDAIDVAIDKADKYDAIMALKKE